MRFAVWLKYPTPNRKSGPFYPRIVDAESFDEAVVEHMKVTGRVSAMEETDFVVARVGDVVSVSRRRRQEFDTVIRSYPDPVDEDE
jgi:hypothetical protein